MNRYHAASNIAALRSIGLGGFAKLVAQGKTAARAAARDGNCTSSTSAAKLVRPRWCADERTDVGNLQYVHRPGRWFMQVTLPLMMAAAFSNLAGELQPALLRDRKTADTVAHLLIVPAAEVVACASVQKGLSEQVLLGIYTGFQVPARLLVLTSCASHSLMR